MTDTAGSNHEPWDIFLVFVRLGLISFGGPIAHLGYFRDEFVARRRWLTEGHYADLLALCQFLPGPASSQLGMAIGFFRGSYAGALAAWAGFTLPSALIMILFALGLASYGEAVPSGALHGLKLVAVAVVAQAVWGMARNLCTDGARVTIMILACCVVLLVPTVWGQLISLIVAAIIGLGLFRAGPIACDGALPVTIRPRTGLRWLLIFFVLLLGLPMLVSWSDNQTLRLINTFYRAGSLVFGGGHVVLPLLQGEVVAAGWVSSDTFMAGYGAAQAVPGPLFTFAAFLGASMQQVPSGWSGGLMCVLAIFAPSFLLVMGALPFWESLRQNSHMQAALAGINAAVVGLLLAALYQPVWTNAVHAPQDFCLALLALTALMFWKLPPWLVVVCGATAGGWQSD